MQIIAFIIISILLWFSSLLFFNQVVQKVNPDFSDRAVMIISIIIGVAFGLGAVFFGGDPNPMNDYN